MMPSGMCRTYLRFCDVSENISKATTLPANVVSLPDPKIRLKAECTLSTEGGGALLDRQSQFSFLQWLATLSDCRMECHVADV